MGYRKLNEIQFFKYALGTPFERKVVTHLFLSTPTVHQTCSSTPEKHSVHLCTPF